MARLIRANTDYATDSERRAAEELTRLPADWVVITNKILPMTNGRSLEIDFIVIGDHFVFAVDEKSWRGRIHGSDAIWVREDGSSAQSPLNKIDYVAKVLAGFLRAKVARFKDIEQQVVVGCVLLTSAIERPALRDSRAADGVVLLPEVVDAFVRRDTLGDGPRVGELRQAIGSALHDLSDRPKIPRQIGPYTIVDTVGERHGSYILRANHEESGPRLLALYNVASGSDSLRNNYLQEFRALQLLRPTGVVPDVFDPFSWSDDFLVVPARLPTGTSLGGLPRPDSPESALRELNRAVASFHALAKVHSGGVVHRALGPDAVYVSEEKEPVSIMFTGFFAAKHGERTISAWLDELAIEDPYAAPEVAQLSSYGFAGPESDTYSLALIFLERLSGVPAGKLVQPDHFVRLPDPGEGWNYLPQSIVTGLIEFFRTALTKGPLAPLGSMGARRLDAQSCAEWLERLAQQLRTDEAVERGGLLDKRYRVERLLGTGASARTFLATDKLADGLFALKQFLRPTSIGESGEARREFDILRNHPHPHLPRVYDVYPAENDVHVKLEYVEGVKLSDALPEFQGHVDRCRRLARDLLDAVEHLESYHLLHRDIKPDNVIIRDGGGEAVLIDFGAATTANSQIDPVGTPGYLPPEAYFSDRPPSSTDQYALAVLLFRAYTGQMPFVKGGSELDQRPISSVDSVPIEGRSFARALLRAVAPDPDGRFPSISAFRAALLDAPSREPADEDERLSELTNPWVDLLRGLYRNSARGNANNRGLDTDFARETYVPTGLDEKLLPAILSRTPRAVFLSGNPGDGKTAFLEQVSQALSETGADSISGDESGWELRLGDHTFRACYDASEAHNGMTADDQLLARLSGLEGDRSPRSDLTVLVAINDGRLADVIEHFGSDFGWLAEQLQRARDSSQAFGAGGAWLIDLKYRAYVGLDPGAQNRSVMRRVLDTFVAPKQWKLCLGCSAHQICPIRRNALSLAARDPGGADVAARLEQLFLIAHLRGQRHVTIRDLRSGLAYLITGDVGCADVHEAHRSENSLPRRDYWRSAFITESDSDFLLGELVPLDPARFARPGLERFLFFHQTTGDISLRASLFWNEEDLPPSAEPVDWLGEVKRRLYFESCSGGDPSPHLPKVHWSDLLPYRFANEFRAFLLGERTTAEALPRLARGIGRSDGLGGFILETDLCLRVVHSEVNHLTVLKRFPLDQFVLKVERLPSEEFVESVPRSLMLIHQPTGARLEISLDVYEMLSRLADGLEPSSLELQPLLEDLAPFKSTVQLGNTRDLVLIEGGRRPHRLTQRDGKVVRLPIEKEGISP